MSIIHDALKKVQQNSSPKATAPQKSSSIYDDPPSASGENDGPVEHLAPKQNKAKSVLALICAIAFTVGALVFSYKQLHPYLYKFDRMAKASFLEWAQKEKLPFVKNYLPKKPVPVPLARITVMAPKPMPSPQTGASTATAPTIADKQPDTLETLNVHGVMANGSSNLALINDQVYQEGDEIDGVKIVKITLNAITVINNGKEEIIHVKH